MTKNKNKQGTLKASDPSITTLAEFTSAVENMNTIVNGWNSFVAPKDPTLTSLQNSLESMQKYCSTPDFQNQSSNVQLVIRNALESIGYLKSKPWTWSNYQFIKTKFLAPSVQNLNSFLQNLTNQNKAA